MMSGVMDNETSSTGPTNKFRVLLELGRGGMAEVYLAVVRGVGGFTKLQVIKRLRPELASDPAMVRMFLDEAKLAARLNHPHIVQTNEVGQDGKFYFIAMEYLDGESFDYMLRRSRETGPEVALGLRVRVVCDILAALHAAHELKDFDGTRLNVIHRDVSPHNVMITCDGGGQAARFRHREGG